MRDLYGHEKTEIKELCEKANRLGLTLEEYLLYRILVKLNDIDENQMIFH